jgi:hypothetical protein
MSNLLPFQGLSHGTSLGRVPRDSTKTASVQGGHQVALGTSGTRGTAGTIEKTHSLQQDWQAEVSLYEIDAFAALLNVDVASIRQDVRTAADHALNSVAIRRDHRRGAADGKRILRAIFPKAEQAARQVSRLDPVRLAQNTVAKAGSTDPLIETAVRQAQELAATLRQLQAERDYPRLPPGGGSDQDRLAAALIDRLARIWTRHTNQPAPGGASGPFCEFVAAAWVDLGFQEFRDRKGEPLPLIDAVGGRIRKFYLRHNRDEKKR